MSVAATPVGSGASTVPVRSSTSRTAVEALRAPGRRCAPDEWAAAEVPSFARPPDRIVSVDPLMLSTSIRSLSTTSRNGPLVGRFAAEATVGVAAPDDGMLAVRVVLAACGSGPLASWIAFGIYGV